jgi:hypothetical protein
MIFALDVLLTRLVVHPLIHPVKIHSTISCHPERKILNSPTNPNMA